MKKNNVISDVNVTKHYPRYYFNHLFTNRLNNTERRFKLIKFYDLLFIYKRFANEVFSKNHIKATVFNLA